MLFRHCSQSASRRTDLVGELGGFRIFRGLRVVGRHFGVLDFATPFRALAPGPFIDFSDMGLFAFERALRSP